MGTSPDAREASAGVENFQEALRMFPPFRDDDGAALGAVDSKCPDCDAVYSSSYDTPIECMDGRLSVGIDGNSTYRNELKQHYLSKYCPGAAVSVYVMMRDR